MDVNQPWKVWSTGERSSHYGDILFKRAIGDLPEMQSSKAVAKRVSNCFQNGDSILDVGCGAGHYLLSLRKHINSPFLYYGVDATPRYIELAKTAFEGQPGVTFQVGDIYTLPFETNSFDVVMCNNLLLHLPSIKPALRELCRVSRKEVIIRTLIGKTMYRIKEARSDVLDETGVPVDWHFLNIYSVNAIALIMEDLGFEKFVIEEDREFDSEEINKEKQFYSENGVRTEVVNGMQVGGNIIHPWSFLRISV